MSRKKRISIVVPCYNEQESLPEFFKSLDALQGLMDFVDFEFIFVDDGSKDSTLDLLSVLAENDRRVKYFSFSRNFGKEAAMLCGLEKSTGDYVALMDADLQDPPGLLPEMYQAVTKEGYDCAAARRVTRSGEPPIRSFFARRFYWLAGKISETHMEDGARDFRLMTRQMVDAVLSLREYNRFSKGLFSWVGFSTKWIDYENIQRVSGVTKWSFWKLFAYSIDGMVAFSVKPLAISSLFGILFCLIAFLGMFIIIVRFLLFGDPVAGWASTVTIVLFVGGIQLFCLGILGQYLAKAYMESKQRPMYIIKKSSQNRKRNPKTFARRRKC